MRRHARSLLSRRASRTPNTNEKGGPTAVCALRRRYPSDQCVEATKREILVTMEDASEGGTKSVEAKRRSNVYRGGGVRFEASVGAA